MTGARALPQPATLTYTAWQSIELAHGGSAIESSWTDLGRWLATAQRRPADAERPNLGGWSAAVFTEGRRRRDAVERVTALVLDIDSGDVPLERLRAHFTGMEAFIHSTRRYRPAAPRWRVVLRVTRPMSPDEHAIVWRKERDRLAAREVAIDEATKDASRFWYVPCEPVEGAFVFEALDGRALDVDEAVRAAPVVAPPSATPTAPIGEVNDLPPLEVRMQWARAYARKVPPAVSGEHGHDVAFATAVRILRGFALAEEDALLVLGEWNASCRPPWGARDLHRKVREAATKGRMPWGALVRERQSRSTWNTPRREPQQRRARSHAPPRAPGTTEIALGTDLHRIVEQASAALGRHVGAFHRGGQLVQILGAPAHEAGVTPGTPTVRQLHLATLREMLTKVASFVTRDRGSDDPEPCLPPDNVVTAVQHRGEWATVRRLVGILEAPALRADGTLLQEPGYDAPTGYLYMPTTDFGRIPEEPTQEDAHRAREELDEVFCDFPFVSREARAVPLAALLTMLARPAILGSTPAFLTDANARGSGKTLVTDAISMMATGRVTAKMAYPINDEELEKVLASYALRGSPLINFDNVTRAFGGGPLDRCLTAVDSVDLRILGRSEISTLPWRAVLFGTGNNVLICGDTARRTVVGRLESSLENPEDRSGFRHPNLLGWIREHRPRLVRAALTLLRAWVVAGRLAMGCAAWGSFESWSSIVPPALVFAGAADPMLARAEVVGVDDQDKIALSLVLQHWPRLDTLGRGLTIRDAVSALYPSRRDPGPPDGHDALREGLELMAPMKDGKPSSKAIGEAFRRVKGRNVGGRKLVAGTEDRTKVVRWMVQSC